MCELRKKDKQMSEHATCADILNKLKNVTRKGQTDYTARCPAHDDSRNSLSVSAGDNGRVLLHCFAGCSYENIRAALGMTSQNSLADSPNGNGSAARRIIATYDYVDESGSLLFQVLRYEPKDFRQRRPDGAGGYIYNLNGVRRVLYSLPELLEADPAITVYVTEGEKDADALRERGLVATCNASGAGKWSDEYSEVLRGRRVALLQDNDRAGREHVKKAAASLCGRAASIKIVELPGLPYKGDIFDWLTSGGTIEELYQLTENALLYQCGEEPNEAPLIRSYSEFMSAKFDAGDAIGFELRRREIGLLASVSNVGKSTLLRNALISLACGGEFAPLVKRGTPRSVALLDFESSSGRLQEDLRRMTSYWPDYQRQLLNEHFFVMCEGMVNDEMLSLSQHLDVIEREAQFRRFDLIAVDTTSAAFNLFDENNNSEVTRRALKPLLELARKIDCAVIMAHHVGKAKTEEGSAQDKVHKPRGASAFSGYAASVFLLSPEASDADSVTLSCAKRKSGAPYEVKLKLDRETRWFTAAGEIARTPSSYELVIEAVRNAAAPVKRSDVEDALAPKVSKATVGRCLNNGVSRGDLVTPKHGIYELTHLLTPYRDEQVSEFDGDDAKPLTEYNF